MDVFDLFAKISLDISEYESGLSKASQKLGGFASGLDKTFSGVKGMLTPAVNGFKAVESVGQKTGDVLMKGVKGFAAASTAVAGFGGSAVQAGMSFDSAMSQVSAISGATGQDFDSLRNKAIEMGAKTKFSATEAAEAMSYMAMAGWKTEDMLAGISGIMDLSAASGEDLARTADIVTDALTAFGYTAADSTHFADVLAVAASNANTDVGMMGETFKYVAPVAGTLGYTVEDTALAIGLMANSGIKASQGGTALRSILNRIATDAGASSKSLGALGILTQELGVEFYNTDGSARDLNSVLMESREAWKLLTVQEQENYAKKIAGEEAGTAWMAMMNASNEDVKKLTSSIEECNGAAKKMADIMMDNLAGDIEYFRSALGSLKITISDALTPTLRDFAQFGTKAMEQLTMGFQNGGINGFFSALTGIITQGIEMLAEKAPEFANVSLRFIDSLIGGILGAKDSILQSMGLIVTGMLEYLDYWFETYTPDLIELGKGIIEHLAYGFTKAGEIISQYIGEFIPLIAEAFLTYHETLFTVGIEILGAIGRGLVENKDQIFEMAAKTVHNIVEAIDQNATAIIEGAIVLVEALANAFEENWPMILGVGTKIITKLIEGISTSTPAFIAAIAVLFPHITKIIDTVASIGGVVGKVVDFVTGGSGIGKVLSIGKSLMGGISSLFSLIMAHPVVAVVGAIVTALIWLWNNCEEFRDAVKAIWDAIVSFFQAAGEAIKAAWEGIVEFFQGVWDGIVEIFQNVGQWFSDVFTAAKEAVVAAWGAVVEFFQNIWRGITEAFGQVVDWFRDIFSRAWEAIRSVWDAVAGFFSELAEGIRSVFSSVMEAVSGFFRDAWEAVKAAWSAAVEFFSGIWEAIKGVFAVVAEVLGGFFSAAWDIVSSIWGAAGEFFQGIWDTISNIFSGIAEWFGDLFSRAWEAITSAWDGVGEFFSGIWDTITGFFSNAWDVFSDIGGNIVKGLWSGIQSLAGWLWDHISSWVQSIWDGVLGFFGINSPARKFIWAGQMNVKGFAVGIDRYGSEAVKAMEGLSQDVSDAWQVDPGDFDFTPTSGPFPGGNKGAGGKPSTPSSATPGGMTIIINSPTAVDPVQAAREWNKTAQRLATQFV